jgi:hypothetical protein
MFIKSIIIGLIIDADFLINSYRLYKASTSKVSMKQSSISNDNISLNKYFNKNYNSNNLGQDDRFPENETKNQEILLNLTRFYSQMNLLTFLENKNNSQNQKIIKINEYAEFNKPSVYVGNIKAGNLFKDWDDI